MEQIAPILRTIDYKFEDINAGGCAFFARRLAKVLKQKRIIKNFEYVIMTPPEYKHLIEVSAETNSVTSVFPASHVMLKVQDYVIDSTGVYQFKKYEYKYDGYCTKVIVPKKLINKITSSRYHHLWNWMFDRKDLPHIEKLLNELIK